MNLDWSKRDLIWIPVFIIGCSASLLLDWLGFGKAEQEGAWVIVQEFYPLIILLWVLSKTPYRQVISLLVVLLAIIMHCWMNMAGAVFDYMHSDLTLGVYFGSLVFIMACIIGFNWNTDKKNRIIIDDTKG